jgi:hypothetical protein
VENTNGESKRCGKCARELPVAAFGVRRAAPDGLQHWCRSCFADWATEHRPRKMALAPEVQPGFKWCRGCEAIKPVAAFAVHRSRPDGRQVQCRGCQAETYRAGREAAGQVVVPRDIPDGHKFCRTCRTIKPLVEFSAKPTARDGRLARCKTCVSRVGRQDHLRRKYGLTSAEVDVLRAAQGGLCAICGVAPAVHVDHDHATGTVRGMLCFPCNAAIGHLRDDPQVVRQAAVYLDKARRAADRTWLQELLDNDQTSRLERAFAAVLVAHQNAT